MEGSVVSANKIESLTDKNYYVWALKISAVLRSKKLFKEVIENDEPPIEDDPKSAAAIARATWESKNNDAFGIIILTLSDEQAGQFLGETKARRIWNDLKQRYAGNVEDRKVDIGLELKNIKMGRNESVKEYITRAKSIASRSATLGQVVSEREITYYIVRGVNSKLEGVAAVLRTQRGATLDEIERAFSEEEIRMEKSGNSNQHMQQGLKTEGAYRATGERYRKNRQSRGCYICGRKNHIAKQCFHRHDNNQPQNNNRNFRNKQSLQYNANKRNRNEQASVAYKNQVQYTFNTSYGNNKFQRSNKIKGDTWTIDSGSTSHMTPNIKGMCNIRPCKIKINLAEDNRAIYSKAEGNMKVTTFTKEGKRDIIIENVLYVPDLRTNLLSVSKLIKTGNKVMFEKGSVKIIEKGGVIIGEAEEYEGIYILKTIPRDENHSAMTTEISHGTDKTDGKKDNEKEQLTKEDKMLWHKRLGHICEEYMDVMKRKEMVRDLNYNQTKLTKCEACIMGKLSQLPHKSIKGNLTKEPLELIHMDICGPMPAKSLNGNRYMYVLVDDFSRFTCLYFMKTKDEAYKYFIEYMNRYETELKRKIRRVRSDNGTEFVNRRFEALFTEKGIKHERTVPYNPQSDGVAERTNRTILDKVRTMLIDTQLPLNFWAEAATTAVYLKNISLAKGGTTNTPMENWNGRKPTVSYTKVFGCLAYYFIPKQLRNKLEAKAKRGIFIGYSKETRAYRIYNPESGNIYAVRTAKFDENRMGTVLLNEKCDENNNIDKLKYRKETDIQEIDNEEDILIQNDLNEDVENLNIEEEQEEESDEDQESEDEFIDAEEALPPEVEIRATAGRKPGISNKEIQDRHRAKIQEREKELRAEGARRSERILKRNEQTNMSFTEKLYVPKNFEEAEKTAEARKWREAMEMELQSMREHNVWNLVPRNKDMKILKSKWVYNVKGEANENNQKFKARLVAVGCSQREGIDYEESFAPVIKLETFRCMMAIAAIKKMKIRIYDVKTAYLYGNLKTPVYMEQPKGFIDDKNRDKVCELQKSLYGLPQSSYYWNEVINESLSKIGLKRIPEDRCTYKYEEGNNMLILGIYVDDFIVIGTDNDLIDKVMEKLRRKFQITENKKSMKFLNIKIEMTNNGLELSEEDYIETILQKYKLHDCNPIRTPLDAQQNLDEFNDSPMIDKTEYQEMLGSLMYLAVGTRPDISFSISRLSQFSHEPRKMHMAAIKRVYRYLKGTKHYKLIYHGKGEDLNISTDASWCTTKEAKSYSGYTVKIGDSIIGWKSQKQKLVALSTCEAEIIAICEGVREQKWIFGLINSFGITEPCKLPTIIKTDSQSAIDWVNKNNVTHRTKHISRKYYFVKDEVKSGNVKLSHVKSENMEADILTKSLSFEKHKFGLLQLGFQEI